MQVSSPSNSNKVAESYAEYFLKRLAQYGVPAALLGAGGAGIAHLVSLKRQQEKENAQEEAPNEIVVKVPAEKTAQSLVQYSPVGDAFTVGASTLLGLGGGFALVDSILRKRREAINERKLKALKDEYSNYLGQELTFDKGAADSTYPVLDGLVVAAYEKAQELKKTAGSGDVSYGSLLASGPGILTLAAMIAGHQLYYNRQKDVERSFAKSEVDQAKKAPQSIKIVTEPSDAPSTEGVPQLEDSGSGDIDDLLKAGAVEEAAYPMMAKLLAPGDEAGAQVVLDNDPANNRDLRRREPVLSDKDIQQIDENTYLLSTDSGDIKIDARDPQALAILERHKDKILKSFALGMKS